MSNVGSKPNWRLTFLRWLPLVVFGAVALPTIAAVVAFWCVSGNSDRAWNLLLGSGAAGGKAWGWLSFVVSGLGYFLVPVVIGIAAGFAITFYTRNRLQDTATAEAEILDDLGTAPESDDQLVEKLSKEQTELATKLSELAADLKKNQVELLAEVRKRQKEPDGS